jgi:hypothetical protein
LSKATHPFKLSLSIEKNGFNFISITYSDARYYSKNKEKKLSPLKTSQRLIPGIENKVNSDYLLTSLKIIRISDNFLPPLLNQSLIQASNFQIMEESSRPNIKSSSSANNEESA